MYINYSLFKDFVGMFSNPHSKLVNFSDFYYIELLFIANQKSR